MCASTRQLECVKRDVSDGNFSLFKSLFCKKKERGECERTGQRECAGLLVSVHAQLSAGGFFVFIGMNLKTGRRVPINKTSGRVPEFYFLFQSLEGNSRFFRNSNQE